MNNEDNNLLANVPFKDGGVLNPIVLVILFFVVAGWLYPAPTQPQKTASEQARADQAFEAVKTDVIGGLMLRTDACFNDFAVGLTDNITTEHASAVGINLEELKSAMVSSAYYYRSDITEGMLVPMGKFVVTTAKVRGINLEDREAGDKLIQEWYRNNAVDVSRIMTKVYNRANLSYWTPEEIVEKWSSPEV